MITLAHRDDKPFAEQLAVAAAVWNSFRMARELAERSERQARAGAEEARTNENDAFRRFLDLAEKAMLEPVDPHG